MAYLFAAYFVLWALMFGYLFTIASRQKRLEREIAMLAESEANVSAGEGARHGET